MSGPVKTPDTLVSVRRHWSDSGNIGKVPLAHLWDFHYRRACGGTGAPSPRPMLYARMQCDALVSGSVSHSCRHGPPPHEILVCITAKDNGRAVHKALAAQARGAKS